MTDFKRHKTLFLIICVVSCYFLGEAKSDRFRCMWRFDPSTSMTIGWQQMGGETPVLYYDVINHGDNWKAYSFYQRPDRQSNFKGMDSRYVRLKDLEPNTVYYFLVKDNQSQSRTFSFKTTPNTQEERLAIIAGGDSRNHRDARVSANKIVGKLRPHFVLFGGDMTSKDTDLEWKEWLDDWQKSFSDEGRITPIVVARGNHEYSNKTLYELFDLPHENMYYTLSFGDDLLKVFTLNSLIASGGSQKEWLQMELEKSNKSVWKMAQYHFATQPHTSRKAERHDQLKNWSTLFYQYGLDLVVESDAHVVKTTYPIRPSTGPKSDDGFERDDENGTIYIGEGCWGAPIRANDDDKSWTRASGSFNQFKWIFVDKYKIEIRTIRTDNGAVVGTLPGENLFLPPPRLDIWDAPNGQVVYIDNKKIQLDAHLTSNAPKKVSVRDFTAATNDRDIVVSWTTANEQRGIVFELQRSYDGKSYKTIKQIRGEGVGNRGGSYLYQDKGMGNFLKNGLSYRVKYILPNGDAKVFAPSMVGADLRNWRIYNKLETESDGSIKVRYSLDKTSNVSIRLLSLKRREVINSVYKDQKPGNFIKTIDLNHLNTGRYLLVIKADREIIRRYQVVKT